mmetsp:Transcript_4262/g.12416  ORF Transcript_4262/g.12416 Transcript_4262/m.12416 type:complete len:219 (-) Transcript_4262:776-1432(-)
MYASGRREEAWPAAGKLSWLSRAPLPMASVRNSGRFMLLMRRSRLLSVPSMRESTREPVSERRRLPLDARARRPMCLSAPMVCSAISAGVSWVAGISSCGMEHSRAICPGGRSSRESPRDLSLDVRSDPTIDGTLRFPGSEAVTDSWLDVRLEGRMRAGFPGSALAASFPGAGVMTTGLDLLRGRPPPALRSPDSRIARRTTSTKNCVCARMPSTAWM